MISFIRNIINHIVYGNCYDCRQQDGRYCQCRDNRDIDRLNCPDYVRVEKYQTTRGD